MLRLLQTCAWLLEDTSMGRLNTIYTAILDGNKLFSTMDNYRASRDLRTASMFSTYHINN